MKENNKQKPSTNTYSIRLSLTHTNLLYSCKHKDILMNFYYFVHLKSGNFNVFVSIV